MNIKVIKPILVFLFAIINMYSCGNQKDTIKIGAILPLTGDVAVYGNNTKEGIDLAVEQINTAGGINGKRIEVIYEDTKADAKIGTIVTQKLIEKDNIQMIIDNSVSSIALAVVPIIEKNKVVLLSTGSTNPKLSGISPYFFRIWNSDALEGKLSANYAYDSLNIHSVSIVFVNNDYGNGLAEVFKKQFQEKGGEIMNIESFNQNINDFKSIIAKLKKTPTDCIYLIAYPKEISNFLKQKSEMNLKSKVIGTVTMEDIQIINYAGVFAEGVIYPFPSEPNASDSVVNNFQTSFYNKYGKKPGITSDVGYDAIYLFYDAIVKSSNVTGNNIRIGLKEIHQHKGASGLIEFDINGDVNKPMIFKVIKNGGFVKFNKFEYF